MEEQEVQKTQEQNVDDSTEKGLPLLKNKRVLIVIGIVAAIIVGLILMLAFNKPSSQLPNTADERNVDTLPQASIYFEPGTNLGAGVGVRQSVKVFIDTQGRDMDRAILVFQYDPKVLTNVTVEQIKDPTSAIANSFGEATLVNDSKNGLLSMELAISENAPSQKGSGQVALLSFVRRTPNPTSISLASNSGFTKGTETITVDRKSLFLDRVTSNNN